MNSIEEFVQQLSLEQYGEYSGKEFIMELDSSDLFSSLYDLISGNFDEAEEGSTAAEDKCMFTFTDGEIEVVCEADYNKDNYLITVKER